MLIEIIWHDHPHEKDVSERDKAHKGQWPKRPMPSKADKFRFRQNVRPSGLTPWFQLVELAEQLVLSAKSAPVNDRSAFLLSRIHIAEWYVWIWVTEARYQDGNVSAHVTKWLKKLVIAQSSAQMDILRSWHRLWTFWTFCLRMLNSALKHEIVLDLVIKRRAFYLVAFCILAQQSTFILWLSEMVIS